VERGGREAAVGGGGGGCWEDTWDVGGTPPTPWGEAVEARCRGDDNPPATTKNTREPVSTISRVHDTQPNFGSRCCSRSDRQSVRVVSFKVRNQPACDFGSLDHLPRRRMTETLFFDASSNYNPRLSVQTRNDVDANERKTVGDVADRPERNCGRKNTVHFAFNVDRDDTRDFEKSRQIRCSFCPTTCLSRMSEYGIS